MSGTVWTMGRNLRHQAIPLICLCPGNQRGDVMKKRVAFCAAAICAGLVFSAAPASAQSRMKTCNDEWNGMKAAGTVGDKKYADFRKECLTRTAAPAAAAPAPAAPTAAAKPAAPAA